MRDDKSGKVNIVGSGMAGLSAAITLAEKKIPVNLFSSQEAYRAQSNLAEGGINAVLNVCGEDDTLTEHFEDTMKSGCNLASKDMVWGLVNSAPEIVKQLDKAGVPFNRLNGHLTQRNFGGQKKKRTAFAKSSTGRMIMTAMTDVAREYESSGLIRRFSHHTFLDAIISGGECKGLKVIDTYTGDEVLFGGPVIIATGGLGGMFDGFTTGSAANTGSAVASLFLQGAELANMEFIQYHPTTFEIPGKRLLISEAARGEGGRLFYESDGRRIYFLEDKYGERGNLMPRDIVSREMALTGKKIFLDMSRVSDEVWKNNLSDMRDEIMDYTHLDPAKEAVPVSPGIHYFMGGLLVDGKHRTNINGLFAAGECACAYHGANRLGGNSLLGAIYGGHTSAETVSEGISDEKYPYGDISESEDLASGAIEKTGVFESSEAANEFSRVVLSGMGIIRDEKKIKESLDRLMDLKNRKVMYISNGKILLAEAMLRSALERKESRGAHVRSDYPDSLSEYEKLTIAEYKEGSVKISFRDIS